MEGMRRNIKHESSEWEILGLFYRPVVRKLLEPTSFSDRANGLLIKCEEKPLTLKFSITQKTVF